MNRIFGTLGLKLAVARATRTSRPTTPPTPAIGQTHVQGVGDVDLRT